MSASSGFWERAILLIDLNAFFASIEQLDWMELRGKPVAVTNGEVGSCIITCSYEARQFGIKTGMRLREARQRCPQLVQCPARPDRYAAVSSQIMELLIQFTPDIEIFSVDEAFLDITETQPLFGTPWQIGKQVQKTIFDETGLLCSVGVSGDKTTAKFAAKQKKPNGLTVIPPHQAESYLADVPVTELCGIADGIGRFLSKYGVYVCKDMKKIPISILAKRFGNLGRRIWLMAQGKDPAGLEMTVNAPKSLGHGKVTPPNTTDEQSLLVYLQHMSEKVACRLRKHQLCAQRYFIGLKTPQGFLGGKFKLVTPDNDGQAIFKLCREALASCWQGEGVWQVQVTALDPQPMAEQRDLFIDYAAMAERQQVNATVDTVNAQFGAFTLQPGHLLNRSKMPNVIAPAWKPTGVRDSI